MANKMKMQERTYLSLKANVELPGTNTPARIAFCY